MRTRFGYIEEHAVSPNMPEFPFQYSQSSVLLGHGSKMWVTCDKNSALQASRSVSSVGTDEGRVRYSEIMSSK
jgi:hypothetical protein